MDKYFIKDNKGNYFTQSCYKGELTQINPKSYDNHTSKVNMQNVLDDIHPVEIEDNGYYVVCIKYQPVEMRV